MKICIPIVENKGLEAKVNAHFGSAPYFLIYDNEKGAFEVISNSDSQHMHGMCHPLKALDNKRSEERRVGKECRSRWSPYH